MNKKLLAQYGLKWNPFSTEIPIEGVHVSPRVESFCYRIENSHLPEGGFSGIFGDPGMGKSVTLRLLSARLSRLRDVTVGVLTRPQCHLADFYREMGEIFEAPLKPHNRWCGFKALRERWLEHIGKSLSRPVLLIDEAQELSPAVLAELRLLSSVDFDSKIVLTIVLAGDRRLEESLRRPDLLPIASRIRTRLVLEPATREELQACLKHVLAAAGNPKVMTPDLVQTLCDHALGNHRALMNLASELLDVAAQREVEQIDERLFLELHAQATAPPRPAARRR